MDKRAKEILIKTQRRLFGPSVGSNISTFQGSGLDFAELREYTYGDDVRKINWKAMARAQKPYINVFHEERELSIVVAFCIAGSIYFGSMRQKQEVMAEILALLGFAGIKNDDKVSVIFFDQALDRWFGPSKSTHVVYGALEYALTLPTLKRQLHLQGFVDFLLHAIKERSILLLVGDFYEKVDLSLLAAKHELYTIVVRDPLEEYPDVTGTYDFADPISGRHYRLPIDAKGAATYRTMQQANLDELFAHCHKHRIGSTKIMTDEDPFFKLKEMLK